jgi:hypothetical protein
MQTDSELGTKVEVGGGEVSAVADGIDGDGATRGGKLYFSMSIAIRSAQALR